MKDLFKQKSDTNEIENFIKGMAQTVAIEENLFDPDCIVLGGGIFMNGFFPIEKFEREVHSFTRKPYPEKNMKIKYSHPTQTNGVIGAAIYAVKRMSDSTYL